MANKSEMRYTVRYQTKKGGKFQYFSCHNFSEAVNFGRDKYRYDYYVIIPLV